MAKPKNPSYRELKRAVEEHPAPWRVRIITERIFPDARQMQFYYIMAANGQSVMQVEDRNLARRIVAAINAKEAK